MQNDTRTRSAWLPSDKFDERAAFLVLSARFDEILTARFFKALKPILPVILERGSRQFRINTDLSDLMHRAHGGVAYGRSPVRFCSPR